MLQLLLRLRHVLRIVRLLHTLLEIIQIAQQLLLLRLQTLELVVEFLLLLFRLRIGQLVLQFLHLLRQRLLPPRQFLEPIQHLQILLLLRSLFFGGGFLFLVALLLLLQLQIHDLILVRLLSCTRRAVLANHLMLPALRTVQPFERRLLKGERLIQRRPLFLSRRLLQRLLGVFETFPRLSQRLLHFRVLSFLHPFFNLLQSDAHRLMHHINVRRRSLNHTPRIRVANDLPGGIDDLFDQFNKLIGLRLRLARLTRRSLHLAEDVFKVPHIRKEHIAHITAHLALRSRVLRP